MSPWSASVEGEPGKLLVQDLERYALVRPTEWRERKKNGSFMWEELLY